MPFFIDSVKTQPELGPAFAADKMRLEPRLFGIQHPSQFAVIKVLPEDYHITDRINGFLAYFKKRPAYKLIVHELDLTQRSSLRRKVFRSIIEGRPELSGIFISNAYTHLAAEYVHANNLKRKVHIIGYDPIKENIKFLKMGVIDFLISQQSERQGYEGIYVLYRRVVLNLPSRKKVLMQLDIITKENIEYYQS